MFIDTGDLKEQKVFNDGSKLIQIRIVKDFTLRS